MPETSIVDYTPTGNKEIVEEWQWEKAYIKDGYAVINVDLKRMEYRRINYLIKQLLSSE